MHHLRICLAAFIFAAASATVHAALPPCGDIHERCDDEDLARRIAGLLPSTEFTFVRTGQSHFTRAFDVAAADLTWQHARDAAALSASERGIVAAELINAYLLSGLDSEAIKLYESLDDPERERATSGAIVHAFLDEGPWEGFEVQTSPQLTAAGLAMAYAEAGASDRVEPLLRLASQPVQPGVEESYEGGLAASSRDAAACVRELIRPAATHDWFAWRFHNASGARNDPGCPRALRTRSYQREAARAMAASNLPDGWWLGVDPNDDPDTSSSEQDDLDAALKKLPGTQARVAALKSELAAIDRRDEQFIAIGKRLETTAERLFAEPRQGDPSAIDKQLAHTLAERLAKPIYNPYKLAPPHGNAHAPSAPCASKQDDAILSCFESPGTRWELSASTDYSPTGEVPAAGFWLRRADLGAGTAKHYYLGIREHLPFELVSDDAPPLIEGDRLHVRVRQAKIDTSTLTFPPLGLQVKRENNVSDLSADLKDIMRDTDGDGLTDLAEQQLLLDPEKTDTDGDGIPDADDPLPNVAHGHARSPNVQSAIAAAIAHISRAEDPGISFLVPSSGTFARRRSENEKTLFIVADPEDFTALSSDLRIIILPRSLDRSLLGKNPMFSVFLPMRVSIEMLGDGRHAEVTFNSGWAGGRLALERDADGTWNVGVLDDWVT